MSWFGDAWDGFVEVVEDGADAVGSVLSGAGDVVEGVIVIIVELGEKAVDVAVDAVEYVVNYVVDWANNELGGFIGGIASLIGGIINGIINAFKDFVHDIADIIKDVAGIYGSLLRLDFPGVLRGLGDLLIHVVDLMVDIVRIITFGYIVGGIIAQVERRALRDFVENLLQENFGSRPDVLSGIRSKLGLDGVSWKLTLRAEPKAFMLDSVHVPLWQWHQEGFIDLYAMSGLLSLKSFQVLRPRTWVRSVDSNGNDNWFPINRWVLSRYISSQGRDHRIRVYAITRPALSEKLDIASAKIAKLGVKLAWNWGIKFYLFDRMFPTHEIKEKTEYLFELSGQDHYVVTHGGLRTGAAGEECMVLTLEAFHYSTEGFGQVGGRIINEDLEAVGCMTKGRTDSCCVLVDRTMKGGKEAGSSVIHRDVWPNYAFRYILPHEIGHYLGLCHFGHDGLQNIMFQSVASSPWSWNMFKYYYQSEPEFTLEDGKNAWRFIVDQLGCCLSEQLECMPHT